ncbi:MAG: sigma factor, partial [Actinomycetota bacterium]
MAGEMVVTTERETDRIRAGGGGLDDLHREHAGDALRLGYLLTGDRSLAEDLVQDAFVKVFGRFHDLRNRDAFWWYLRRTIVNLAHSQSRRRRV